MRGHRRHRAIGSVRLFWMLLLIAPASRAAGLGELQLHSHINEPFEARVEVTGSPAELEDARASLGGDGGITAGEGYSATLVTRDGNAYVLIRSQRRVAEPLLHLVLRLRAGGAQVQRDYDVLLDLPEAAPPPTAAPSRAPVPVRALQVQPDGPDAGAIVGDSARDAGNDSGARAATRAPAPAASTASRPGRDARPPPPPAPRSPRPSTASVLPATPVEAAPPAAVEPATPPPAPAADSATTAVEDTGLAAAALTDGLRLDDQLRPWLATPAGSPPPPGPPWTLRLAPRLATPPASAAAVPAPPASTVVTPPPAARPDKSKTWLWLLLAALVLLALWARRRRDADADMDWEADEDAAAEPSAPAPVPRSAAPSASAAAPPLGALMPDETELLAGFQEPLRESMEVSDPGVGFYGEVAQLLLGALDRDPQRADLRLKLLEIFHDARETERFRLHAQRYRRQHPAADDPNWAHIRSMGLELLPDEPLFAAAIAAPDPAAGESRPQRFYEYLDAGSLDEALRALASEYRRLYTDPGYLGSLQQALAPLRPQPTPLDRLDDETSAVAVAAAPIRLYGRWEPARTAGDDTELNARGQVHIAQRLGRRTVITATRASRHALAVARSARERGLACRVHMRESDHRRHAQALRGLAQYDVDWVLTPDSADGDARTAALGDWLQTPEEAFYVGSTAAGPHPYPSIVRDLRAVLGAETRSQLMGLGEGPPLAVVVGRDGGAAALSLLQAFLDDRDTALYCVEPAADGTAGEHQREHAWLRDTGRVRYTSGFLEGTTVVDTQIPDDGVRRLTPDSRSAATFARRLAREIDRPGAILVLLCGASQIDFEL